MIVFDLHCSTGGERFEAWFRSGADFESQREQGLVQCPFCQSTDVNKAPMAAHLPRPAAPQSPLERLARQQTDALRGSRWVGDEFAQTARAMHEGEREVERVHGQATVEQARELISDGVPILPLPLPVVPADQVN